MINVKQLTITIPKSTHIKYMKWKKHINVSRICTNAIEISCKQFETLDSLTKEELIQIIKVSR